MTFGYHPMGAPTCLCKQEVEKPSWNAAQPCARVQGCVNNNLRADGLRKGWSFPVGTWNVDSLTGRAGEVVEALSDRRVDVAAFKEHDGKAAVASSMKLKVKDINCSGWEATRDWMVQGYL